MSGRMKKWFGLVLVCVMLLTSVPGVAFTAETEEPANFDTESIIVTPEINEYLLSSENRFDTDVFVADFWDGDLFFYLEPCEQIFSQATLADNFEDNAVIIVLNRAKSRTASRDNRDFTARDFRDIGALYVENLSYLSERENAYAQQIWVAEHRIHVLEYAMTMMTRMDMLACEALYSEVRVSIQEYKHARQAGEENTLRNFDEFRRILLIRLDQNCRENVLRVIQQLEQREYIYSVGPNYRIEPHTIPPINDLNFALPPVNDPYFLLPSIHLNHQWAVNRLSLPQAWGITVGSPVVRVGIVGHGVEASHPELIGRVRALSCGSLTEIHTGTRGAIGNGTQQAGIIGATGNNGMGIAGIAWNVEIVSVGAIGSGDVIDRHLAGINRATQERIPILTRSFSGPMYAGSALYSSVREYNGLFINSAGNDGQNTDSNPLLPELSNVIIVGASDMNDRRSVWDPRGWPFHGSSNFGRNSVHIFAPGGGLIDGVHRHNRTTLHGNSFGNYNGTSAAAPHVAGVAALVWSVNPHLTPQEVRGIILDSVDPIPAFANISYSGGRLNAYNAVRAAGPIIRFTDIPPTHWAHHFVEEVARAEIITGTAYRQFSPYDFTNRAQFATILGRMYRLEGGIMPDLITTRFPDVPCPVRGFYFAIRYVAWADSQGIVLGMPDGTFGPGENVTREQLAVFLFRYAQHQGRNPQGNLSELKRFVDNNQISWWAREAMAWAVGEGIIVGRTPNTLAPGAGVLRAEAAVMVYRYLSSSQLLHLLDVGENTRPDLSIRLTPESDQRFPSAAVGYGVQAARTISVSNAGTRPTRNLTVTLSGENAGSFTVNTRTLASIPFGNTTRSFTVRPNTGLPAGTHTATVTVSGINMPAQAFMVSFTVTEPHQPTFHDFFPDPALAQVVAEHFVPARNANDPVTEAELANIGPYFYADGRGIQSLEGIQYLTNMWFFELSNNAISDVSPLAAPSEYHDWRTGDGAMTAAQRNNDLDFDALRAEFLQNIDENHWIHQREQERIQVREQEQTLEQGERDAAAHSMAFGVLILDNNHVYDLRPLFVSMGMGMMDGIISADDQHIERPPIPWANPLLVVNPVFGVTGRRPQDNGFQPRTGVSTTWTHIRWDNLPVGTTQVLHEFWYVNSFWDGWGGPETQFSGVIVQPIG